MRRFLADRKSKRSKRNTLEIRSVCISNNGMRSHQECESESAEFLRYTGERLRRLDPGAKAEYHRERLQYRAVEMVCGTKLRSGGDRAEYRGRRFRGGCGLGVRTGKESVEGEIG